MQEDNTYNILVVDDQSIVREGIRSIIELSGREHNVYEANHGLEAISMSKNMQFDVILMDINMPIMDGVEASRILLASDQKTKILVISMLTGRFTVDRLKKIGVSGFVSKDEISYDLLSVIDDIVLNDNKMFPENYKSK